MTLKNISQKKEQCKTAFTDKTPLNNIVKERAPEVKIADVNKKKIILKTISPFFIHHTQNLIEQLQ